MKKKMLLSFSCMVMLILASFFISCQLSSGPNDSSTTSTTPSNTANTVKPLVGVVFPVNYTRWVNEGNKIKSTLEGLNYRCTVYIGDNDTATQIANIQTLVTAGMKALIVAPVDGSSSGLVTALASAKAAGVKIISYDRLMMNSSSIDIYTSFNNIKVGEIQGQFIVDQAATIAGSGKPLYLYTGDGGDNNAKMFFKGAWNKLQPKIADGTFIIQNSTKAKGLQSKLDLTDADITSIFTDISITYWSTDNAKLLGAQNLAASGALKGSVYILAANDSTAQGLYDIFHADTAITSIVITGQDADKTITQRIIDGQQSMTVFKDTRTLAEESAKIAIDLIEGRVPTTDGEYNNGSKVIPSRLLTATLITKTNLKAILIDSGYYKASDFTGL